jgi:hypothetical protein
VRCPPFGRSEHDLLFLKKVPAVLGIVVHMVAKASSEHGSRTLESGLDSIDILQDPGRLVSHILEPYGVFAFIEIRMSGAYDADFQGAVDGALETLVDSSSICKLVWKSGVSSVQGKEKRVQPEWLIKCVEMCSSSFAVIVFRCE